MKKRNIIIVIAVLLIAGLSALPGSFSAYTSLSSAKRVVSTIGSSQLFSSNIMLEYADEGEIGNRAISFSADSSNNSFKVTVCNYAQGEKTKWMAEDIDYTMSVKLIDADGIVVSDSSILDKYLINGTSFAEYLASDISKTLNGGDVREDIYTIVVPAEYIKEYKILLKAIPQKEGFKPIGRYISTAEYSATSEWRLTYMDDEKKQGAYELGCINTKLSGTEHANVTLSWDSKAVEIDPWFLVDMDLTAVDNGDWRQVTFEVGGVDMPRQYSIIFYRTRAVNKDDVSRESWDDIISYISFESEKISE